MPYYCYLLQCEDGSFYCGWTNDLQRRFTMHTKGRGSRYTRIRLPVRLVYFEELQSRAEAMKREISLKKLNHNQKKKLAEGGNHNAF